MAIGAICGAVLVIIIIVIVSRWYYRKKGRQQNTLGNQMSPLGPATSTTTRNPEQTQPLNPPKSDPAGYHYAPTGPYNPTTVPYAAPTGPYNPTTAPYAAPTGPYNPTTAPYNPTTVSNPSDPPPPYKEKGSF